MTTRTKIFSFIFIFLILQSYAVANVKPQDISEALTTDLQHPYLYFTEDEKTIILERIQNDPECNDIMRRLLAEANRSLYAPVDTSPPARTVRPRYETTFEFEEYLHNNTKAALDLAFVYQMTGEEKYAQKAFEFVDVVCDQPTWVYGAHEFPVIYDRVWPWGTSDDQVVFSYGQWTDDLVIMVATIYDWLYPALEKRQRDCIRGALLEKAILRVRGNYEYHWWATAYRCNWCAIVNSSLGVASIALLTEDPQLVDVIAESYNRIDKTLDEIGVDGGWQEGCGYYRKSIHGINFFAEPLKRLTGGKYNLYNHPRLKANPITFLLYNTVTPRRLIPFEDSKYYRAGTSHIWNKLTEETRSKETAWFRDYMFGRGDRIFDIIWPRSSVKPGLPEKTSRHFRTIDWAIMRSDFTDPENVVLACKAGMNDDPHHGHLDCGHFIVYWRDQEYICDITSGPYDEKYFNEDRWEYPQASSVGHNVVFVDGELQIPAKLKNQPWKEGIGGKILEFRPSRDRDYTLMDPSGAYPGKELRGWRRHLILEKPVITVLLDEISSSKGAEIEMRFHSHCTTDIKDRYVLLHGDKGAMALIPVVDGGFSFRPGKHASLPVTVDYRFEWTPYWGTVVSAHGENTVIATIILPVENENEVEEILKSIKSITDSSGNLTVSFSKDSRTYNYRFKKCADGLVLE